MCKIVIATNLTLLPRKTLLSLQGSLRRELNKSEKDGFGFAYLTNKRQLVWRKGKSFNALPSPLKPCPSKEPRPSEIFGIPIDASERVEPFHGNGFFRPDEAALFGLWHGRTCTSSPDTLANHPHIIDDVALIHNGVVSRIDTTGESLPKNITGCDSEDILHTLLLPLNATAPADMPRLVPSFKEALADNLKGYFALGVIDAKEGMLYATHDDLAELHFCVYGTAKSDAPHGVVFATTKELIKTFFSSTRNYFSPLHEAYSLDPYKLLGFDFRYPQAPIINDEITPMRATYLGCTTQAGFYGSGADAWERYEEEERAAKADYDRQIERLEKYKDNREDDPDLMTEEEWQSRFDEKYDHSGTKLVKGVFREIDPEDDAEDIAEAEAEAIEALADEADKQAE